jgi:hypothetical protein
MDFELGERTIRLTSEDGMNVRTGGTGGAGRCYDDSLIDAIAGEVEILQTVDVNFAIGAVGKVTLNIVFRDILLAILLVPVLDRLTDGRR